MYSDHAEEHLVERVMYPRLALKLIGVPIGLNCRIRNGLTLYNYKKGNLSIGNNVHIGKSVLLDLSAKIEIQDNCTISMGSKILTHQNFGDSSLGKNYPVESSPIVIEENVYIGANGLVLHSTDNIAPKTLLAANSTLSINTNANSIYAGSPAVSKKNITA